MVKNIIKLQLRGGAAKLYTRNTITNEFEELTGADLTQAQNAIAGKNPSFGGVTEISVQTEKKEDTVKVVNQNKIEYGKTVLEQTTGTVVGGLFDTNKNLEEDLAGTIPTSQPKEIEKNNVELGIIQYKDKDGNLVTTYGTQSTKTDKDGTQTSTLTSAGLTTTGTISGKSIESEAVRDANGKLTSGTVLDKSGLITTGTVTAAKITLGDADLQETLDAETKARTDADNALDGRITTNTSDIAKNTSAISGFDNRISDLNTRANQLNQRVDDVEKTAYRGVAIALAAQQNVPNIKPGQFAVFGGVGHYESESAFAMGVVGAINERTSISGALGVAGGSEVGGRVGVAYVFGGK